MVACIGCCDDANEEFGSEGGIELEARFSEEWGRGGFRADGKLRAPSDLFELGQNLAAFFLGPQAPSSPLTTGTSPLTWCLDRSDAMNALFLEASCEAGSLDD